MDRLFEDDEEEASYNWPTAPGEVFSVCVQSYRGDEGCRAEITYSYSANGEYYSGVFQRLLGSEDDAQRIPCTFAPGHKLLVHYRPDKPEVSTLFEQDMNVG
ncbi:MAG TPA: DUF3592 domain-containing protein [Terriglobales bacterium]|nr:DUF3592 domain-containing protein [Terriglobales bacterium]